MKKDRIYIVNIFIDNIFNSIYHASNSICCKRK